MRKNIILLLLTFVLSKSFAQINTDRPDQTESSSTVPNGAFQLESGILLSYEESPVEKKRQFLLPTNLLRFGITNWFELRLVNQVELLKLNNDEFEGFSDIEVGTKIQLLKKENINAEIALLSHLIIPTGSNFISNEKFGNINKLCVSHEINKILGISYNLGYNYFGSGIGDLTYSLALGVCINDKAGVYIESYGELINMNKFITNFDAGFTYLIKDNLQFDLSFGLGINQKMNYFSIGCSWLVEKKQ